MKTKAAAAEFLNVSERAIERYARAGRLLVTYRRKRGRPRDTPYFSQADLEKLKQEMTEPKPIAPAKAAQTSNALQVLAPGNTKALQRLVSGFGEQIALAIAQAPPRRDRPSLVALTGKLTLTREELIERTNLPWTYLLREIKAERLRGEKVGAGKKGNGGRWSFKCDEVDAFVDRR